MSTALTAPRVQHIFLKWPVLSYPWHFLSGWAVFSPVVKGLPTSCALSGPLLLPLPGLGSILWLLFGLEGFPILYIADLPQGSGFLLEVIPQKGLLFSDHLVLACHLYCLFQCQIRVCGVSPIRPRSSVLRRCDVIWVCCGEYLTRQYRSIIKSSTG